MSVGNLFILVDEGFNGRHPANTVPTVCEQMNAVTTLSKQTKGRLKVA